MVCEYFIPGNAVSGGLESQGKSGNFILSDEWEPCKYYLLNNI